MKTRLVMVLLGFCWLATRSAAQDWPRYGHDGALTGRSPIRGAITAPHVAWTYSVAGRELRLELEPVPGEHRVTLNAAAAAEPGSPRFVPAGPRQLDIDGRGTLRPAVESFHERWAKILPGVPGYQRVGWNFTWTDQPVCRLQLFAYDRGFDQPRCVWQSAPPEAVVFNPLNVVYDIDGDGVPEICVAAHYRVMIFDGVTGRKKTELRYHSNRPYGWFGLADVDGDGQMELVTIGDFQSHVDVLKYDRTRPEAERLKVLWRRDIETNIEERKKWPQVGPHPLADVNGDGRPELILNLFNDTGDGQWHAVVLDAASGRTLWDLPRRFVQGSADVDGDGAAELFLTTTNGELVPACGTIELVGVQGQKPVVRQSYPSAAWCLADLPCFGPTWSTTASQGMQHVLLRGKSRPTFFVKTWQQNDSTRVTLSAMRCRADRQIETLWKLENLPEGNEPVVLEDNAKVPDAAAMVRVRLAANETAAVAGHDVRPRIVENRPLGGDVSMPIVAQLRPGQGRCVVVEGPGQQVFAIAPPRTRGERPQLVWQRPGRGMRDGSRAVGLLAADLDGDGACEVVAADQAREGHARLVAYRGDGTTLWQKAFPQTNGALPAWNVGALTFWWPGRFRQPDALDLFVNTRRGLMHSDVGHLLDGRNATTLWTHDKAELPGEFRWGYAGIPLAAADLNADRLDELVCLYPVCYWTAEGRTGRITAGKSLASRQQLPAWAAYGEPMVYDFHGGGRPEVLLDSPYLLALLDTSGKPLWHGPGRIDFPVRPDEGNVGQTTNCKHALVDIAGDGKFEIASAGYGDGVRLIDPRTGKVLWSLAAPAPTGPRVTAANIDGRGGDEIIYPAGNTLVAITGDRKSGRLLWTWQGPAALSLPAIADVDGDGLAEIVVQDAAGTVHCLAGVPTIAAPPAQAAVPRRWLPSADNRETIDFAEPAQADAWLRHVVLGDPSFDSFGRRQGNPIVRGKPPFAWPVNGFLFEDPRSGNWYAYVGHYLAGYDIAPGLPKTHCRVHRSRDKGRSWEDVGPIFDDPRFRFEGDSQPSNTAPDVSVVADGGRYHMAYDWCTDNTTWANAHHPSGGADSGCAYAWSERPEGPFHRARRPILRTSEMPRRFALGQKYPRAYGTTLIRRAHDWLTLTLTDSGPFFSWGLMAMTAADPEGAWTDPVMVLGVEGDRYFPPTVESFPAVVHDGYVYASNTSVAANRNFQVVYRAKIESAHRPESWELFQHGTAWHSEPVIHEGLGIWGQTYSGFVDRQGEFQVLFPSREKESGLGTINLASRPWDRPLAERGFTLSGHEGPSMSLLRATWNDFHLKAALRIVGGAAMIVWACQSPLGADRHSSGATPNSLCWTRQRVLKLTKQDWRLLEADAAGSRSAVAAGTFEAGTTREVDVGVRKDGRTELRIDGRERWEGVLPLRSGEIGLSVEAQTNAHVARFSVGGRREGAVLPWLYVEALTGAGVSMSDWDVVRSPLYRFGVGAVRKTTGGRAKWNFRGRGFRLWSPKGPQFGRCDLLLNGEKLCALDLHADRPERSQVVFDCEDASDGYHAVVLRSTDGLLVVDALDALN